MARGISEHYFKAVSCYDLSSDHSPVIVTLSATVIKKEKPPTLCSKKTNWNLHKEILNEHLTCNIPLKIKEELEATIDNFNTLVQKASWESTPAKQDTEKVLHCAPNIKVKFIEKRKLRKVCQKSKSPHDKAKFNKAVN